MKHQIFPQSNLSSFLSLSIFCYISLIKLQIFALLLYLIHYGTILFINLFVDDFKLAYLFDIKYIISGFFVNLAYGFLIIGVIQLYGAFDRLFRWCSRAIILALFMIYIYRIPRFPIFDFILKESSFLLFFVKVTLLWIAMAILSILLIKYTRPVIYKKKNLLTNSIIAIAVFIMIYGGFWALFAVNSSYTNDNHIELMDTASYPYDITPEKADHVIDVSNIADKTLITANLSQDSTFYNIICDDSLVNTTRGQILIDFVPRVNVQNHIDMNQFIQPKLEVTFEDNQINLRVTAKKNFTVVFISPYTLLNQFKPYQNNYKYGGSIGSQSQSGGGGCIAISLPKYKYLSIKNLSY